MTATHIAFFLPDLRGGGAQKMIVNMANEFAARGGRVDLVIASLADSFYGAISPSVRVIDLKAGRTFLSVFALATYLKEEAPDAMIGALSHANAALVLAASLSRGAKTKIILTERNFFSARIRNSRSLEKILTPFLVRTLYPRADKVIGISKGVADDIRVFARLPASKVVWIHNPVISDDMVSAYPAPALAPANDVPLIVTSGRLVEQKDHRTMLKAFSALLKDRPAKLVIYGWGALEGELKALASSLGVAGRVTFKPFVQEPLDEMAKADLFVISSRWEGFCNVIVEALFCGVPVVSTDCPAGPAEILENGKYGILVPVGDAEALAQAMKTALGAPPARADLRARAMDFNVKAICDRYHDVIFGTDAA